MITPPSCSYTVTFVWTFAVFGTYWLQLFFWMVEESHGVVSLMSADTECVSHIRSGGFCEGVSGTSFSCPGTLREIVGGASERYDRSSTISRKFPYTRRMGISWEHSNTVQAPYLSIATWQLWHRIHMASLPALTCNGAQIFCREST